MGAVSAVLSGAALAALSREGELRGEDWQDILPAQCSKDFTGVRSRYTLSWSPSNLLSLLGASSCKRDKSAATNKHKKHLTAEQHYLRQSGVFSKNLRGTKMPVSESFSRGLSEVLKGKPLLFSFNKSL